MFIKGFNDMDMISKYLNNLQCNLRRLLNLYILNFLRKAVIFYHTCGCKSVIVGSNHNLICSDIVCVYIYIYYWESEDLEINFTSIS